MTEPLKIWGLPTVGIQPAGGLPPLHALKYYRCAKMPGAAPCRLSAGRDEGFSPRGIPGGCRTLPGGARPGPNLPILMVPYLDHVATIHLKSKGTVGIANDSVKHTKALLNPICSRCINYYPLQHLGWDPWQMLCYLHGMPSC